MVLWKILGFGFDILSLLEVNIYLKKIYNIIFFSSFIIK